MIDDEPIGLGTPSIDDADVDAVVRVLRSGWLSTGREAQMFEAELSAFTGAPHVLAMSSCTAALEVALDHLRLQPGDRVGVPTWTFVASASSVVRAGGVPVLLDVEPDSLNVDPEAVRAELDEGLRALVVVHLGGVPVARSVFEDAASAGVPVLEDAAHALGAVDHRGPIGGAGTLGACFSFYASKNLTTGEGGALATHDPELASFAASHRLHGLTADAWARYEVGGKATYDLHEPGLKANLPDLLAALGRSQLRRFPAMQRARATAMAAYRMALADIDGLRFVPGEADDRSAHHLAMVVLPLGTDRDQVMKALASDGIGSSIHFRPLHKFSWYAANAPVGRTGLDTAEALAGRVLSLPLHAGLTEPDVERVVASLRRALR